MDIIWSDVALKDFHQTLEYLISEWSEASATKFSDEVETILAILKKQPNLYPLVGYSGTRKAFIRKQISLFYKFEGNKIYLIRLWNNFQNPENLKV